MTAAIATAETARLDSVQATGTQRAARRRWALVLPALIAIGLFGIGPLLVIVVYSFLEPATYGGVVWNFSTAAYVQFLFERDLFTEELAFTFSYLQIFGRSIGLAALTTTATL